MRGVIDVLRRVYTISGDTKVASKLIELMLLPCFSEFASKHGYEMVLAREQNHYPDMSFVSNDGSKFAVDLKSTYRESEARANTMTLGAYSGYFRNRATTKTTTFPYGEYSGHFVIGVVYDRAELKASELKIHQVRELEVVNALEDKIFTVDSLDQVPAVVRNLCFFAQPKYRIAKDVPGSGNTRNIGAVENLVKLTTGNGPFAMRGEAMFDDY